MIDKRPGHHGACPRGAMTPPLIAASQRSTGTSPVVAGRQDSSPSSSKSALHGGKPRGGVQEVGRTNVASLRHHAHNLSIECRSRPSPHPVIDRSETNASSALSPATLDQRHANIQATGFTTPLKTIPHRQHPCRPPLTATRP